MQYILLGLVTFFFQRYIESYLIVFFSHAVARFLMYTIFHRVDTQLRGNTFLQTFLPRSKSAFSSCLFFTVISVYTFFASRDAFLYCTRPLYVISQITEMIVAACGTCLRNKASNLVARVKCDGGGSARIDIPDMPRYSVTSVLRPSDYPIS